MLTQIVIYRLKVLVQYLSLYLSTVPSNIESIQDQNVTEGDNLTLTCSATGVPQPKVSWIKPGGHRHNGHTLAVTHIKRGQLVNTNVKPVVSVVMQQRRQPFMCCVSFVDSLLLLLWLL